MFIVVENWKRRLFRRQRSLCDGRTKSLFENDIYIFLLLLEEEKYDGRM